MKDARLTALNLYANNVLCNSQYGFRKGRGCEECILASVKAMEKMRVSSKLVAVISLDIKGAFDHLLWSHILKELHRHNVPAYLLRMYQSYLSEKKVILGGSVKALERGCPQGSVVGPLLWNSGYNTVLEKLQKK